MPGLSQWEAMAAAIADSDIFGITDVSDPTQSVNGTSKRVSFSQLLTYLEGAGIAGGLDWSTAAKTANFTANAGYGFTCDTSGGSFTETLPNSPTVGDVVATKDISGSFDDFPLTIDGDGEKIEGSTDDMTVDTRGWAGALVYTGTTYG